MTFIVFTFVALITKQILYKRSITTPVNELQSMRYEKDPSKFVKDYITAINKGDLNKAGYMNGASLEHIKQNFILTLFKNERESFPDITDITVRSSDDLAPTVTVYCVDKVNDLEYTNFILTWNNHVEMWNVNSYRF